MRWREQATHPAVGTVRRFGGVVLVTDRPGRCDIGMVGGEAPKGRLIRQLSARIRIGT
jgi:hypothetical protein